MIQKQEAKNKQMAFRYLGESLSQFHYQTMMADTVDILARYTPNYFWHIPASTSGKYHPPAARVPEHGLVWHVNHAVRWGGRLLKRIEPEFDTPEITTIADLVRQALILHDIWKNGRQPLIFSADKRAWPKGPAGITGTHGGLLAKALASEASICPDVVYAIGAHMGPWTDERYDFWKNRGRLQGMARAVVETVQLADYCAAQYFGDDHEA